jgi:hypothetical protein
VAAAAAAAAVAAAAVAAASKAGKAGKGGGQQIRISFEKYKAVANSIVIYKYA